MNKTELIAAVADKAGITKKDAERIVNATVDTIIQNLSKGEKVQLSGFGTFEVRERAERKGRNPKTGEVVSVPACKYLAFVPAKAVKETLN